ncbi:MAG: hypothetical protein GC181_13940 [Bacteroidetes bacterium]|nr:hypothetical protein [Bacteroidota bacterium]
MSSVNYTIFKSAGDPCGAPTHFSLMIQPEPGLVFMNAEIQQTEGLYVTEIKLNFSSTGPGAPVTIDLCDAPVVCPPESVPLNILTSVDNDPAKAESTSKNYTNAEVGGKHRTQEAA